MLDGLITAAGGIPGVHLHQLARGTNAIGDAVLAKGVDGVAKFAGGGLLILPHRASRLVEVSFEVADFAGESLLLFGQFLACPGGSPGSYWIAAACAT